MSSNRLPNDDHYVPNLHNAHLDLEGFERELRNLAAESLQLGVNEEEIVESFYFRALSKLTNLPDEPGDGELVCRFLTPKKFLWFVSNKDIRFCSAQEFDDPKECSLPEDYENSVGKILCELDLPASEWENQIWSKSQDWLVSCWTVLRHHHDDNLIWHKYAEGSEGVGITIRYGQLKGYLKSNIDSVDVDGSMKAGRVSYEHPLRLLPFNKRRMFQSENEIRFSCRHFQHSRDVLVDISNIFTDFGLRFSPDAPDHHRQAVKRLWRESGGAERFQEPDGG